MTGNRRDKGMFWAPRTLRVVVISGCALVLALPWLRQSLDLALLDALDRVLGMQCHRIDGRVASLGGVPMAVCSRCAGIYGGVLMGALLARPRWSVRTTAWVVLGAVAGIVVEAGLEVIGLLPTVHALRWVTGAALAWPVSALATRRLCASLTRRS
jgi:uncharacterized membrane protein